MERKNKTRLLEIRLNNWVDKSSMKPRMPNTRLRNKLILLEIRLVNLARTSRKELKMLLKKPLNGPRMPKNKLENKLMLLEIRLVS